MELDGARILVAGAPGALGGALARALGESGADLALAGRGGFPGRRPRRRARRRGRGGGSSRVRPGRGAAALDVQRIFEVNALGPIGLVEASLAHMSRHGAVVGVSAIVADHPTAGVSHYSAAKAAFSAYLTALRRERRRDGLAVLDVRPPHMDTSFGDRPIFGRAPALPEPLPVHVVVDAVMDAIRSDRREIAWDLKARSLVTA